MTTPETKNPPLQTFRHDSVFIKLWANNHDGRTNVSATIGRVYKDKQTGEYKETRSFRETDLLIAETLMKNEVRPEMRRWKDYYKEVDRQHNAERAPEPQNDLVAQRDAALAAAPQKSHENALSQSRSR